MHFKHVVMSVQLLMAFAQVDDSKSGQVPMFQPIDASVSSSPLPQFLFAPPQALAMLDDSLTSSLPSASDVFVSVSQTVLGGSFAFVFAFSHLSRAFARPSTYFDDALARLR